MKNEIPVCESEHPHCEKIAKVKNLMPDDDELYDMSELFKVFGDSTRTSILARCDSSFAAHAAQSRSLSL